MLYEPNEIRTSETQLEKIFKQLKSPTCLVGGWAAYHIDQLFSVYPKEKVRKTIQNFTEEDINKVSTAIGISTQEISRVLTELTRH